MGDVARDPLQQGPQGNRPVGAVQADAIPVGRGDLAENPGHLAAYSLDQPQFLLQVATVIRQPTGEEIGVPRHHRGAVFGQYPLHAVGVDRFKVGEVRHHLQRAPATCDWSLASLFGGQTGGRAPQQSRACQVGLQQFRIGHSIELGEGRVPANVPFRRQSTSLFQNPHRHRQNRRGNARFPVCRRTVFARYLTGPPRHRAWRDPGPVVGEEVVMTGPQPSTGWATAPARQGRLGYRRATLGDVGSLCQGILL